MIFFKNTILNLSLCVFMIITVLFAQKQYSDINAMLNEVEPFQDEITGEFFKRHKR